MPKMNKIYQKLLFVLFLFSTNLYAVPILTVSGATNFPDVVIGSSSSVQNISLINTGSTALTISNISHSASNIFPDTTSGPPPQPSHWCGFGSDANANANPLLGTPIVLNPGASCNLNLIFVPQVIGTNTASVVISSDAAASPSVINLTGNGLNGAAIGLNTTSLNFGNQAISTSSPPQDIIITNIGSSNLNLSPPTISGPFIQTNNCLSILPPSQSCAISVIFNPGVIGTQNGTVLISHNAPGSPTIINLLGNGVGSGSANLSRTSIAFTSQIVNTASPIENVKFTNTGTIPINISSINIASGFSFSSDCPLSPAVFLPGTSCNIDITFNPISLGMHNGSVNINTDLPVSPTMINLTGLSISPPPSGLSLDRQSIDFGIVLIGDYTSYQSIVVTNIGNQNEIISPLLVSPGFQRIIIADHTGINDCGNMITPLSSCKISMIFNPLQVGVFSGFVYFTTSDGTSYKTNLIGEAIEKMALINVDNSVNFGNVYVGDTKQQELLIKNTGNDLLLISDLQINDQNYSLENSCSEIKPDNSCILKINYSPKSETLNLAWLIIYSNSSGVSTVSRVELIGRGTKAPAPQIEVDKTIINFGEVLTIFSKNESINIYNRGNKDLLINNIAFDFNNFYNLEHNCQTIKPQESCRITVLFSPVIWGSHHNKIIISSNAGDKEVVLNGRGCRVFSLVNSRYYNLCGN